MACRTVALVGVSCFLVVLALPVAPLGAQSLYDRAQAALQRDQLDSAYDLLRRAVEAEPDRAEVQFLLGNTACQKAGRAGMFSAFGLARKCKAGLSRAVQLAPDSLQYLGALASFLWQAPGIVGGDKDSAMKLAARVRGRDEVRGAFLLAGLWWGAERGLAQYEGMVSRDPKDAVAQFFLGRQLVLLKRDPRRAQEHLQLAAAAPAPPPGAPAFALGAPWYRLGQTYVQLGMPDSARICLERALQINPQLQVARAALDSLTRR